ncbi:hypothetical protein GCM10027321_09780 [Massilia terrae]|uniref:PcRGLX/YetA-like N-terminal RIFT barrel domain-containing protein n=1 Tax=Massilia terrae TaxID=1811224 RepID=A0ABT2D0V6_9BURK|nr:hypothetical protein [Massilia terrae]MCS0659451.1 hypothetical protein [Massilia terrae]
MMPSPRIILVLCVFLSTFARADEGQRKPVGLPSGGQLDAQRVIAERYGSAPAKASLPEEKVKLPEGGITTVIFDGERKRDAAPVTFGQVFTRGDLKPSDGLAGKLADGATVPLQVDVKAHHADGSVRHAVISAILPQSSGPLAMALVKTARVAGHDDTTPAALLAKGFSATVTAVIDGRSYSASADKLLAQAKPHAWLSGPIVHEWLVDAPLRAGDGAAHPHLAARFAIRWYPAAQKARVDVAVENDWAYEPAPRNFTYDATVTVGGARVYAKTGLTHFHHARWRKVFWWGGEPDVRVRHDAAYLIATRALPNYDRSVMVKQSSLRAFEANWKGDRIEPMGSGLAAAEMPTTGGRPDIGLLPAWAAMYLLSMDRHAQQMTLGTADLAGSWSMHYRDRGTGRPVSVIDHPYMTVLGQASDTFNPATGKREAFPACAGPQACDTPFHADVAHQPAFAYLPYLVTGDYYYLEELQFWAMFDAFYSNPGYREYAKGLMKADEVRAQAWGLRTLAEAAYITPDDDPLKPQFKRIVEANLDWYNAAYANNPRANALGALVNGHALSYFDQTGVAPWQDDLFTSAVGHAWELGFDKARPLLAWKARFPIARMTGPGACWVDGAIYALKVRDSANGAYYGDIGQAWRASRKPGLDGLACGGGEMAAVLKLKAGEMTGYSSSETGFPSNMQPALAYAADVAGEAGEKAWKVFMARSVKPDYGDGPQFAIVPRE